MADAAPQKIDLPLKPSVETLQQQIDSGKEAVRLLQDFADRTPTTGDVQWQVLALKELTKAQIDALAELNNKLNAQRDKYEERIADILAKQKDKDALLLSTQVDKLGVTTGERLSLIEKNQYSAGGSASVRDPAIAEAIAGMSAAINKLTLVGGKTEGKTEGINASWGVLLGVASLIGIAIVAATFIIARAG